MFEGAKNEKETKEEKKSVERVVVRARLSP